MQWLLRLSLPVRGGLLAAALVAALLIIRLFTGPTEETPSESVAELETSADVVQPAALEAAAAGVSWTIDDLGAPDDPLPGALPVPAITNPLETADAADTLARQVLSGTPESFPALIAALQASGVGIVGPGNGSDVKPAEPWQGIVMRRWEARTVAAMVLPERSVSITLSNLAAELSAVIPDLQGAPVEQLIVADLRALAGSQVPTKRFLGRFIAALGRNATSHDSYDLLGDVDPRTIHVDGVQASLIFRRLATDFLLLSGETPQSSDKRTAVFLHRLRDSFAPVLHAQGLPCTLSETERTVADLIGLGSQLGFGGVQVGDLGFEGLAERVDRSGKFGSLSNYANTLLAYAQFMVVYATLAADVTIDASPLVRTKKATQTGEHRELSAVVKLNIGNLQMLNCFRQVLNLAGLDFSLPNDGPVKGAVVTWYGVDGFDQAAAVLHGGSEAIVQFVSSGSQSVTNAVTGDDGKVQIGVEGRRQRRDLSNDATEVPKSAKVRLNVALRGADFFGDLQEAAATAAGGLGGLPSVPLGILSRMQWATVGHYRFPVTDWRDGPPEWTGTIMYSKVMVLNSSETFKGGNRAQDYRDTLTLNVTITETLPSSDLFGSVGASMRGTAHAKLTGRNLRTGLQLVRCSNNPTIIELKSMQLDTSEGSGAGTARVSLGIAADGQYSITIHPEVMLNTRADYTGETQRLSGRCGVENQSSSPPTRIGSMPVSVNMQGDGRIDPAKPDRLTGRSEEKEGPTTETLTWDLQRR